jgi:stage V sporulation protein AE
MDTVLLYMRVFLVGGLICMIGQVLTNTTKMTSARVLTIFLILGMVLEAVGVYKYIREFAKAGATVPITGFGSALAKGVIEGTLQKGLQGAITAGVESMAGGLGWVIFLAFILSLIARPKTK